MDKIKRNERLGALTRILMDTPNRIHTLSEFCELFGAAKSTISEAHPVFPSVLLVFLTFSSKPREPVAIVFWILKVTSDHVASFLT